MKRYYWFFTGAVALAVASPFVLQAPLRPSAAAAAAAKADQLVRLYVRILGTSG